MQEQFQMSEEIKNREKIKELVFLLEKNKPHQKHVLPSHSSLSIKKKMYIDKYINQKVLKRNKSLKNKAKEQFYN